MMTTKSFSSLPLNARVIVLTHGTRVRDVADACRSAALAFARSANHWSKRELAMWLVGPYARAVAASSVRAASGVHRARYAPRPIPAEEIARLVESAHAELHDSLRRVWSWRYDSGFARDAIDAGIVAGILDDEAAIGYAPVDRPDMKLVDRVRSLFLADYFTRPRDYASFAVCPGCGAATFDLGRSHDAECAAESVDVHVPSFELEADVSVEIVGEIEIEIDTFGVDEDDVDPWGNLRDTILDPIELAGCF
jgi:hypothetical protein